MLLKKLFANKAMQGYRGGNRQHPGTTYLLGLWLAFLPALVMGQPTDNDALPWYIPQSSANSQYISSPYIIHYNSWTDLAEKLVERRGKPYHLVLVLDKNTPADWAVLRTVPPAVSLSIELADSLMSDSLLPMLATWLTLKKLQLSGLSGPRSYTVMTNGKGEAVFGLKGSAKRVSTKGWDKLRSIEEVSLRDEIDLAQAITAIQALPALETLTVNQFVGMQTQDVSTALAGLRRLRRLTIWGDAMSRKYKATFREMVNLTELTIHDPDVNELNASLTYLPNLRLLNVTCIQPAKLRVGNLSHLETLRLRSRPDYTVTRISRERVDAKLNPAGLASLDSVLAGLTTLKSLEVESMKLQSFPASLLANKGLTYLAIPDAELTALPDNLDQLVALEELIIDNNPLHRLPAALSRLPRLRHLSVNRCELDSLPAAIGQLTSLTNLSLNSNQLIALPQSMGQLKELRQLNVAMNQLAGLPAELARLPKLETIAAFWNKITRFPTGLTQVRELYLTDNLLTELPAALGTLTNLQTLLLDNNPLTSLPENIGQLHSLETLVLGNNQLTALPRSMGLLRSLRRFVLGPNQVRDLPETIGGLTSLTSVSISDNPISRLPTSVGAWQGLKFVQLKLPQLEAIPEQIGRWRSLETLSIESDRLVVIPNELTDCGQLADLSIVSKRLIGLPETVGTLTHLERLNLEGRVDTLTRQGRGQVIALPASLANCKELTTLLVLNQQQFDRIEGMELATNLPRLKHLAFINCGITDLSGIAWRNLSVTTLNLSQNRFSQIPAALLEMPNLEQVNLSETSLPQHLNQFFPRKEKLVEALKKVGE